MRQEGHGLVAEMRCTLLFQIQIPLQVMDLLNANAFYHMLGIKLTSGGRGAKGAPGGRPGGGGGAPFWYGYPTGRAGSPGCRGKPGG